MSEDKHYRVSWIIDVWESTPKTAASRAAGYAEQSAMRSVYEVQEIGDDDKPAGEPVLVDLEEVLFEGEKP